MSKTHKIVEGVNGDGTTKWMVITENAETGAWIWIESFQSKAEADSWLKHAC